MRNSLIIPLTVGGVVRRSGPHLRNAQALEERVLLRWGSTAMSLTMRSRLHGVVGGSWAGVAPRRRPGWLAGLSNCTGSARCALLAAWLLALLVLPGAKELDAQASRLLSATRDLRIDAEKHDLMPFIVMVISPSGEIIVNQLRDRRIRRFSPSGTELPGFGREGAGPGEFQRFARMGLNGDTLWIYDGPLKRITLLSLDLKLLSTQRIPLEVHRADGATIHAAYGWLLPYLRYSNGDLLGVGNFLTLDEQRQALGKLTITGEGRSAVYVRVSSEGLLRQVIIGQQDEPGCASKVNGVVLSGRLVPECPGTIMEYAAEVPLLVRVTTRMKTRTAGEYNVVVVGDHGDTVFAKGYAFDGIRISARQADSLRKATIKSEGSTGAVAEAIKQVKLPAVFMPVRAAMVGRDSTIWLSLARTDGRMRYQVLDPKGNPLGIVMMPGNFKIRAADRNHIWGIEEDEDGFQSIVRYRISSGGSGTR